MKNIVYLIGAGASAESLPMVSNMKDRMRIFLNLLEHSWHKYKVMHSLSPEDREQIIQSFKELLPEILKHATPDTYAKKLFLKEEKDKLKRLKFFLSSYFIFEQLSIKINKDDSLPDDLDIPLIENPIKYKGAPSQIYDTSEVEKLYNKIEKRVDDRYDVFYATLLEKNGQSLILPSNVSILSWNYDFQIELAYRDFDEKSNPQKALKIFPNAFEKVDYPQVVKLNGTAGLIQLPSNRSEKHPEALIPDGTEKVLPEFDLPAMDSLLLIYSKFLKNELPVDEPLFKFAWENDDVTDKAREHAKLILSKADILVIIGYSFPNFNRIVDLDLLKDFNAVGTLIYYQAPKEVIDDLINRFKGLRPTLSQQFIPIADISQFYIPYEFNRG